MKSITELKKSNINWARAQGFTTKKAWIEYVESTRRERSRSSSLKSPIEMRKLQLKNLVFSKFDRAKNFRLAADRTFIEFAVGDEWKIETIQALNSNYYAKSCKFAALMTTFKITSPFAVFAPPSEHLSDIDGIQNLWAKVEHTIAGTEIIRAVWLVSKRGLEIQAEPGWIARREDVAFHSTKSAQDALDGLRKKINRKSKKNRPVIKSSTEVTPVFFRKITGACKPGCDIWIENNGLGNVKSLPAIELIAKLRETHQSYLAEILESAIAD